MMDDGIVFAKRLKSAEWSLTFSKHSFLGKYCIVADVSVGLPGVQEDGKYDYLGVTK